MCPTKSNTDSHFPAIQATIMHYRDVRKKRVKVQKEAERVQKLLQKAESNLQEQKKVVDKELADVRAEKEAVEKRETHWLCPSQMWKNQGLELVRVDGHGSKENGHKINHSERTHESGDDPSARTRKVTEVADGEYLITLSDLPNCKQTFKFRVKFENNTFSILEADSNYFSVTDCQKIETAAQDDCRHLVVLLRHHIVTKLSAK